MTEECLVKLNKEPSLPVSIPIHIYRKTLKKKYKYISNKPINMSTNTMSTEQQTKKQCQTIRRTATDENINIVAESSAYKRPAPERPVPTKPVRHPQKCERLQPERPISERSAPERPAPERPAPQRPALQRPAPERPAPERPAPERPAPERTATERLASERLVPGRPAPERPASERPALKRPAPERPEREEFERMKRMNIQCCDHVCSMPFKHSVGAAVYYLITVLLSFMNEKSSVSKCTQTDNITTIEDIEETLKASDPVLRDITAFSNQFKQFFAELGSMCQVFFKVKTKDNKEVFAFSQKKRQLFLNIIRNVIDTLCCDDTDIQPPKNIVTIDVDEIELVDTNVSERQTDEDNTVLPQTTEVAQQDNQHNQSQKESVNSIEVETRANDGVIPREDIVVNEQTVTNQTIQRDLREQEICDPTLMEESVNKNISINNEMNIDQTTFNPQILDNTRRFCSTPRPQATRHQQFYQNQTYRFYHNKMFRHPNRGNGRPPAYPQRRTPMRNTERPPAMNITQSQSALMYSPYNQQQLQQQFMIQQYCQGNPDTRQNTFPNQN